MHHAPLFKHATLLITACSSCIEDSEESDKGRVGEQMKRGQMSVCMLWFPLLRTVSIVANRTCSSTSTIPETLDQGLCY